jgi:hypothetical protein
VCAKPTVTNGVVSPGDATVGVGAAYSVACAAGYSHASGDMTCQNGQTLAPTVTCVAGCAIPVGPN